MTTADDANPALADVPLTNREDAIARYGSHWEALYGDDIVIEHLGPVDNDKVTYHFPTFEAAAEKLRQDRQEKLDYTIKRNEHVLSRLGNRIRIWKARRGWGKNPAGVLEQVAKLEKELEEARKGLAEIEGWLPEKRLLPEKLVLPAPLAIGRKVYLVDAAWPLSNGIKMKEVEITSIWIGSNMGRSPRDIWDYEPHYSNSDERVSFTYNRPDYSHEEIKLNILGYRLFLTRKAAEDAVRQIANQMREVADNAEREFCVGG